ARIAPGVAKVGGGPLDPSLDAAGGLERLREAGVETELADGELGFQARQQNRAWLTWVRKRRPFVTYKAAMTLDGRLTLPGSRWISGEESRQLVHELRAGSDAVAVGMGTARGGRPGRAARGCVLRQRAVRRVGGSGAALRPARGRARPPCRRGSAVAAAGRRADARDRLHGSGPDRQAARLRSSEARGLRADAARGAGRAGGGAPLRYRHGRT